MNGDGRPLTIRSWPEAIMHMDADAFFASCEQAVNPALRGRPVITGRERGIVAAASYEAKARGVERGMTLHEAKRVCPEAVCVPSDYETYSLFSLRMFEILRRFSPAVEEYSIDEAFVDLKGLRRLHACSYGEMGARVQEAVEKELGLTVSVGVSTTKVLAKVASKHKKPRGLTVIPGNEIHLYLEKLPAGKLWGIGPNTAGLLGMLGVRTALDLARKDEAFVKRYLSKPFREVWDELNGRSVYPVEPSGKSDYQSISKTRTFTPPSNDRDFVFGQLSRNLENACIKARRHQLSASSLVIFLKTQDFCHHAVEIRVSRPTAFPLELLPLAREGFQEVFRPGVPYRATGVVLSGLVRDERVELTLFDDPVRIERLSRLYGAIDELSRTFGKHTVGHTSSMPVKSQRQHEGARGDVPRRKTELFSGENKRQRVGLPLFDMRV